MQTFVVAINTSTKEVALAYLAEFNDGDAVPSTSGEGVPVFEDARLLIYLKRANAAYTISGHYIVIDDNIFDDFAKERDNESYKGFEIISPPLLYFLKVFKVSKYSKICSTIIHLQDAAQEHYHQWCSELA